MNPFRLVINEDSSHFFGTRSAEQMTRESLHAWVDQYAGTQVSHLFLNPNCMRTSYRSAVWDAIWDQGDTGRTNRWIENARLLDQSGLDPYAIWIDRARTQGLSPWLSMRMNDVHNVDDPTSFIHSRFWVEHPEYWRVPGSTSGWTDRAFDFGIPAVREYHLQLVRELLNRYDPDGLELDWMRFGFHFKPGHEIAGNEISLAFMRQVRELAREAAKRHGHPIPIGVRVPARPEAARGMGLDGVAWARAGLVDVVIPTPFFSTSDFDIPIDGWRELLGSAAKTVALAAGHELLLRAYPAAPHAINNAESVRGFATASLHRGSDFVYLFNYMDNETTVEDPVDYRRILNEAGTLSTVQALPRRHVVTYTDTWPPGVPCPCALPAGVGCAAFRIDTGPAPRTGQAVIRVGLSAREGVTVSKLSARINSEHCAVLPDEPATLASALPGVARLLCFGIPLAAMNDGYNLVELAHAGGPEQQVVWVEIRIVP